MLGNQVHDDIVGRQITLFCHFPHNRFIGKVIIIIMIVTKVKEPVTFKPERLMYFKIQAYGFFMF
jgi:hypothetical protein